MPQLKLDDAQLYYEDSGGSGLPVVLSHGFLMDREMFDPVVKEFSLSNQCIGWDQRYHGDSAASGPYTYWDSAEDLIALLDHLDVEKAVLLGMSMGGFVSLRAALTAPERVAGLLLIATQAGTESPEAKPMYDQIFETWAATRSDETLDAIASILLGSEVDAKPWKDRWRKRDEDSAAAVYRALMDRDDITERLDEIEIPAIVVHGNEDTAIPMDRAETLRAGLPDCRNLVVVEGGPHCLPLSHPREVNAALSSLLETTT